MKPITNYVGDNFSAIRLSMLHANSGMPAYGLKPYAGYDGGWDKFDPNKGGSSIKDLVDFNHDVIYDAYSDDWDKIPRLGCLGI